MTTSPAPTHDPKEGFTALSTIALPKFNSEDIGKIVGPSAKACEKNQNLKKLPSLRKEVVTPAWRSYTLFKKKVEGEIKKAKAAGQDDKVKELEEKISVAPKTPYIRLESGDDGVFATIEGDSEVMVKFVKFHLNKYQDTFVVPKKMNVFSLYATLSHDSVGALIGRGGSTRKALVTNSVANMDEETEPEDLEKCEKSIVKMNGFTPRDSFQDFDQMVKDSQKHDYVGWPPEEGESLVKIHVTNFSGSEAFEDFVECLKDSLRERVNEINQRDKKFSASREDELREVEQALGGDW